MMRSTILFLMLLPASGCARDDRYPSLLPRAVERQSFAEPAAPPAAPVVADPALDARIAAARLSADEAAIARAEQRVRAAAGAAAGSETWLDAQVALGELDALRSGNVAALSDLEELATDRAAALEPDYLALNAAIEAARAAVEAQTQRIATLQAMLAS